MRALYRRSVLPDTSARRRQGRPCYALHTTFALRNRQSRNCALEAIESRLKGIDTEQADQTYVISVL